MYKLLIVEDEKWEREGLRDFLDWEGMGIEVVGCACNGMEGESIAKASRPQIIITDIRMPILDGILMSKSIRSFLPNAKIIMLTGYDDFEYAKQTFSFHAFAYLLKPVQKKEIEDVIVRALKELDDEKCKQNEKTTLEAQWHDYIQKNRKRLLIDYLSNKTKSKIIFTFQPLSKLRTIQRKVIVIISFCLDLVISNNKEDFQKIFLEVIQSFNHTHEGTMITASCGELPEEVVLCMDATTGRKNLKTILLQMIHKFEGITGIQSIAGIGETFDDIELAPHSYTQAREAISFRFLANCGEVIFYSSIADDVWKDKCLYSQLLENCDLLSGEIVQLVQKGDIVKCTRHVDELLEMLIENRSESKNLLNRFMMNLVNGLNMLFSTGSGNGVYVALWDPDKHGIDYTMLNSIRQTKKYLLGLLGRISINIKKSCHEDHIARRVLSIIEKRYPEKLDLKKIADEIHFSPDYIRYAWDGMPS